MEYYNDNYPPGFNGRFPWDDDDFILDYDNAFESTLEFLRNNPEEYRPNAKELFLAMGGRLKTEDDFYEFDSIRDDIKRAIKSFENESIKENKTMNMKRVVKLTENQLKKVISESVKKVLNENMFPNKNVEGRIQDTYSYLKIALKYANENANVVPEMQKVIQLLTQAEELLHGYFYESHDYEQDEY